MRKTCALLLFASLTVINGCADVSSEPSFASSDVNAPQHAVAPNYMLQDKLARLNDADPNERAWAAYQLGKFGDAAATAIPALLQLLQDDTPVLLSRYLGGGYHSSNASTPGEEACQALVKIGHDAVSALQQHLRADKAVVRQLAAKALGQIGELSSIPELLPLLDDPDRQVRAFAALALGSYRHPQAAKLIIDALPTAKPGMRAGMVYALGQINDVLAVPILIQQYPQEDVDVRAAIMYALGRLRDGEAIATLLQGLRDTDEVVRANAANALVYYSNPRTMNALITALDDPSDRVRETALEALQQLTGAELSLDSKRWRLWWQQQQTNIPHHTQ